MVASKRRRDALAEVQRWRVTISDWRRRQAEARSELQVLEATIGEKALDDPAIADRLVAKASELRARVEMAAKAITAAQPRLVTAQQAVLELDAQEHDRLAADHRAKLNRHEARTVELLSQLQDHEGVFLPEENARRSQAGVTGATVIEWTRPKSADLKDAVAVEELKASVLRDVAAGADPAARLAEHRGYLSSEIYGRAERSFYGPAVWGPGAVMPAPAFLSEVDQIVQRLRVHDQRVAHGDAETIERLQREIAKVVNARDVEAARMGVVVSAAPHRFESFEKQVRGRQARIAELEAWHRDAAKVRESILDELEEMTGSREVPAEVR